MKLIFMSLFFVSDLLASTHLITCYKTGAGNPVLELKYSEGRHQADSTFDLIDKIRNKKLSGFGRLEIIEDEDSRDGYKYVYTFEFYNGNILSIISDEVIYPKVWNADYHYFGKIENLNCRVSF